MCGADGGWALLAHAGRGLHAVVSLDISNPARPVEVSRIIGPSDFASHWLAKDPNFNRLILGQEVDHENRMLMLRVDPATGKLSWDESLRSEDGSLGLSFVRNSWPHGNTGEATGHAALFVPRSNQDSLSFLLLITRSTITTRVGFQEKQNDETDGPCRQFHAARHFD
jgi:hypothetical protein